MDILAYYLTDLRRKVTIIPASFRFYIKSGWRVGFELFAEDIRDGKRMSVHKSRCTVPVALLQCTGYRIVLVHGFLPTGWGHVDAEPGHACAGSDPRVYFDENQVPAVGDDPFMDLLIERPVELKVLALEVRAHGLVQVKDLSNLFLRCSFADIPDGQRLEVRENLIKITHPLRRELDDLRTAPGPDFDNPLRPQNFERFAHRTPRNTEMSRNREFINAFARGEFAIDDHIADPGAYVIVQTSGWSHSAL